MNQLQAGNNIEKYRLVMEDEVYYIYLITIPSGQTLDSSIDRSEIFDTPIQLLDYVAIQSDEDCRKENMDKALELLNQIQESKAGKK